MKKKLYFLGMLVSGLMLLASCQTEEFNTGTTGQENLSKSSPITGMLLRITTADTITDNPVDSTSCLRLQRPYDVNIHDGQDNDGWTTYTVTDDESQQMVNNVIAVLPAGGDMVNLVFPLTVIRQDGSAQTVASQSAFDIVRGGCSSGGTDPMNCVEIHYPVTLYTYDPQTQQADSFVFHDDAAVFAFLAALQPGQYYQLAFPILLTYSNGNTVSAHDNASLLLALQQAEGLCSQVDPCSQPNSLTEGLIIYAPFANEAKDLVSGTDFTANPNFGPQFVTDRSGNANAALSFSGAEGDFLQLAETAQNHLKQGDSLTISLWFRMQNTDPANLEKFFEKSDGGSTWAFFVGVYDMNRPLFLSNIGGITSLWDLTWNTDELWNDTQNWHHLAVTIEGDTNTVKIYRDGALVNTAPNSSFNITSEFFDYYLGRSFKGYLDDLRVYRSALTASQITELSQLQGDVHTCLN